MSKLRGAVVGCGMISEYHLRAWQRIDGVDIVAVADQAITRATARRDEFAPQALVYEHLQDLLQHERLDFLDIVTPPAKHRADCLEALESGLHVICQKPMAENINDARSMVDAFSRSNRMLTIHENHRYRPWFREILRYASEGMFGRIRFIRFEQFDPQEPPEEFKLNSSTGILLDYGIHIIDMIHALLGPPCRLHGRAFSLNPRVKGESLVHIVLEHADSVSCIDIAWKPNGPARGSVHLLGDAGEAIYDGTLTRGDSSRFRLIRNGHVVVDEQRSPTNDYIESFHAIQQEFILALRGQGPQPQPAAKNLQVMETTFAVYDTFVSENSQLGVCS